MKHILILLAVAAALLAVTGARAQATTDGTPFWVTVQQQQLAPGCGNLRAHVIAQLVWNVQIHQDWADQVEAHPELAPTVGDTVWHRHWIQVYRQAIALLTADCKATR